MLDGGCDFPAAHGPAACLVRCEEGLGVAACRNEAIAPLRAAVDPPGLAREYLSHPAFDDALARPATWVLAAARVPRPAFDELTGRGVHVTQAFGMSEGLFLFTPLDAPADLRAETVGVPISPLMKSGCSYPARRSRSRRARPESWPRADPTPSAGTSLRRTVTARPSPQRASIVPAT